MAHRALLLAGAELDVPEPFAGIPFQLMAIDIVVRCARRDKVQDHRHALPGSRRHSIFL